MQSLRNNLKKPLFRSILFSYLVLCVVLLIMSAGVYAYHYRVLKDAITKNGLQEAELISAQFNDYLTAVQHTLDAISAENALRVFNGYSEEEMSRKTVELNRFSAELFAYVQSGACSDLLVWFDNTESILRARDHRVSSAMLPGFIKSQGLTEEAFREALHYKGLYNILVKPDGTIWMMRSVLDRKYRRFAVVIATIGSNIMPDYIRTSDNIYMLFHDDELLFSTAKTDEKTAALLRDPAYGETVSIGGIHYLPVSKDLGFRHISLRVCLPAVGIYDGLRVFYLVTLLELAGAVALVIILSVLQTHRFYAPVQEFVELLKSRESEEFEETYTNLLDGLSSLKTDYAKLVESKRTEEMKAEFSMVQHCLTEGLESGGTAAGNRRMISRWSGIAEDAKWTMALIHVPEKWHAVFGREPMDDPVNGLDGFILKNVAEELLSGEYSFNMVPVREGFLLLTGTSPDSFQDLAGRLEKLRQFFQQAFEIDLTVILSDIHSDFSALPSVYAALAEELRYTLFWEVEDARSGVLQISSTEQELAFSPSFSLENNRRLLNCLDAGDYENAYQVLDQILTSLPRDRRYLNFSIYRMYGLISTLCMVLESRSSDEDEQFWIGLDYEKRLYNVKTLRQLLSLSRELFDRIIAHNEERSAGREPAWLRQVIRYIQENYADVNLSVSSIADRFRLSVPHLSRTFKTAMSCGLLEYIQKLRVEKARDLLEKGHSVAETASLVGYAETKALRRAFQRYEGINPSEYQKKR